jgi:hypothetical protein
VTDIDSMKLAGIDKYRQDLAKLLAFWDVIKKDLDRWNDLDNRTKFLIHMSVRMILVDTYSFLTHFKCFLSGLYHQSDYFKHYSWKKVELPKAQYLSVPGDPKVSEEFLKKHHSHSQKRFYENRKGLIADFFDISVEEIPKQKVPQNLFDKKIADIQKHIESLKKLRNRHAHIYDFNGEPEEANLLDLISSSLEYSKEQISKLYMIRGSLLSWSLTLF